MWLSWTLRMNVCLVTTLVPVLCVCVCVSAPAEDCTLGGISDLRTLSAETNSSVLQQEQTCRSEGRRLLACHRTPVGSRPQVWRRTSHRTHIRYKKRIFRMFFFFFNNYLLLLVIESGICSSCPPPSAPRRPIRSQSRKLLRLPPTRSSFTVKRLDGKYKLNML